MHQTGRLRTQPRTTHRAAHQLGLEELAEGADPQTGRAARRTLPGITTFEGLALPEVASVTVTTPRGVRTLVPSGKAHAFLVVYDGTFPTGEVELTSEFRDGSTKTMRLGGIGT